MNFVIIIIFLIPIFLFTQEASGQENQCDWTLEQSGSLSSKAKNIGTLKVFSDIQVPKDDNLEIICVFDEPISLNGKLIG